MAAKGGKWVSTDVLVVGAGILGVAISYWLSCLYDCRILLVDREPTVAAHASSRNTGVLHRPYYLNPRSKKVFARSAERSYPMWRALARRFSLPWSEVGTLNVAPEDSDVATLEKYRAWGEENGVPAKDLDVLDGGEVRALEPEVSCKKALLSRTDVSVDFGSFARALRVLATNNGASFMGSVEVESVADAGGGLDARVRRSPALGGISCKLMINAAGGGALAIAHSRGLAEGCAELNFRGDYWVVGDSFASRIRTNIYTPPRYPQFPFLDPHFIVRADGSRQIGPNAALVTGPYVYKGLGIENAGGLLSSPLGPKLGLLTNATFISMAAKEWYSSISRGAMCARVRRFIPGLESDMLGGHGISGVRCSIVDRNGFVPEALVLLDDWSAHVLNYNSPGATGAPSFSAMVVARLISSGLMDSFHQKRAESLDGWDYARASEEA